nr:MAG TPA: hypothetical protein [Bacteriophage sp.]
MKNLSIQLIITFRYYMRAEVMELPEDQIMSMLLD